MADRVFVDTNVFVYAYDTREPAKRAIALRLLEKVTQPGNAVISTQVVQEFASVVIAKIRTIGTHGLLQIMHDVFGPIIGQAPSIPFYERAVQLQADNALSFYDALIVQAALDLDCKMLYSEDLQDGQKFGRLEVVNPFKEV